MNMILHAITFLALVKTIDCQLYEVEGIISYTFRSGFDPLPDSKENETAEYYTKEAHVASYIQNFKSMMGEYVKAQYTNLTVNEYDKIQEILEEFLLTFAKDLREVVEKQHIGETKTEEVDDDNSEDYEDTEEKKEVEEEKEDKKDKEDIEDEECEEKNEEIDVNKDRSNVKDIEKKDIDDKEDKKDEVAIPETIKDDLPDSMFQEINARIREEFPAIHQNTADEIVTRLRKNLLITRQKIDVVIKESQKVQAEIDLD